MSRVYSALSLSAVCPSFSCKKRLCQSCGVTLTPVTSTKFLIKNFLIQSPNNKVTDTKVPNATQCLMLQISYDKT